MANIKSKVQKSNFGKRLIVESDTEHQTEETDTEQSALLQTGSLQLLYVLFLIKISVKKCSVGNSVSPHPPHAVKERKHFPVFQRTP